MRQHDLRHQRLRDGSLPWLRDEFRRFYDACQQHAARRPDESGGNFWNSQNVRIGRRFGAAVRRAVTEGRLSWREA